MSASPCWGTCACTCKRARRGLGNRTWAREMCERAFVLVKGIHLREPMLQTFMWMLWHVGWGDTSRSYVLGHTGLLPPLCDLGGENIHEAR